MAGGYVLGVDGGKSKTVCLLAHSQEGVIGTGRSGSSDKYDVTTEQALQAVADSVRAAAEGAGLSLPVQVGCFGLAGADWAEDFQELESGLTALGLAEQVLVKNDMHIALHANAEYGVVVSAGTHTSAAIRTPDGREWHAGWFAVEGPGGVSLGHHALWAVLQAYDGRGRETVLEKLILSFAQMSHPLELLRALSEGLIDDAFLASLAPLVFQAHHRFGDSVATEMLIEAGKGIADWATGLLARFDLMSTEMPVLLCGGLFKGEGRLLLDTVTMMVHARAPKALVKTVKREPVIGALFYAFKRAGYSTSPELIMAVKRTAPGPEFYQTV